MSREEPLDVLVLGELNPDLVLSGDDLTPRFGQVESLVTSCGGATTCSPTTCAASAKNCGAISSGCGATLDCGSCSGSATCGGGGVANVCGSVAVPPPVSTGSVRIMPLGDSITLGVNDRI